MPTPTMIDWRTMLRASRQQRDAIDVVIRQLEFLAGVTPSARQQADDADAAQTKAARKVAAATALLNGHAAAKVGPKPGNKRRSPGALRELVLADIAAHPDSRIGDIFRRIEPTGVTYPSVMSVLMRGQRDGLIVAAGKPRQQTYRRTGEPMPDGRGAAAAPPVGKGRGVRMPHGDGRRLVLADLAAHPNSGRAAIFDRLATAAPMLSTKGLDGVLRRLQQDKLIRVGGPRTARRYALTAGGAKDAAAPPAD